MFIVVLVVLLSLPGKNRRPITYFHWHGGREPKTGQIHYGGIHFSEFGKEGYYWWPKLLDDDPRIREISVTGIPGHPRSPHGGMVIIQDYDRTTREMWLDVPLSDLDKLIHVQYETQSGWDWWWDHTEQALWDDSQARFAASGAARFFRGFGLSLWYSFLIGLFVFSLLIGVLLIPLWVLLGGFLLMQSPSLPLSILGNVMAVIGGIATGILVLPLVLSLLGSAGAEEFTAKISQLGGGLFRIRIWK